MNKLDMHPVIKSFYEKEFGDIVCIEEPSFFWKNVPAFYYIEGSGAHSTGHVIACPFDDKLVYYLMDHWYDECAMLKILKLKAFL